MPYGGRTAHSSGGCGGCSYGAHAELDAHLVDYEEGLEARLGEARGTRGRSAPQTFCPGASSATFAPDLQLEPIHLDVTLHVDLDQQCLVVDEVLSVRLNASTKSNAYTLTLDGIGFQHLHASRVTNPVVNSETDSGTSNTSSKSSGSTKNNSNNKDGSSSQSGASQGKDSSKSGGVTGLFSFFKPKSHEKSQEKANTEKHNHKSTKDKDKGSTSASTASSRRPSISDSSSVRESLDWRGETPLDMSLDAGSRRESISYSNSSASRDYYPSSSSGNSSTSLTGNSLGITTVAAVGGSATATAQNVGAVSVPPTTSHTSTSQTDSTLFYCTYDGRKITLTWVGTEAFGRGQAAAIEKVRLIYLVEKPVTGLYFTKPPTEVELEMLEQQQKPMVASTFYSKKSDTAGRTRASEMGRSANDSSRNGDSTSSNSRMVEPSPEKRVSAQFLNPSSGGAGSSSDRKSQTSSSTTTTTTTSSSSSTSSMAGRMSPFHASRPLLACTDHETERARYWLAIIDHPSVRPTAKWTLVVKAGLTAIANGEMLPSLSDAPIPHWPLSLFSPPISSPKAPTYPKTIFVWNNPYPTASYLIAFAVGQLHYIEAIPPRHIDASKSSSISNPSSSSSSSSTTGSTSSHKRTRSIDGNFGSKSSSSAQSHSSLEPAPQSARASHGSSRLGAIAESRDGLRTSRDDFEVSSTSKTSSTGSPSNTFNPFSAFSDEMKVTEWTVSSSLQLTSAGMSSAVSAMGAATFLDAPVHNQSCGLGGSQNNSNTTFSAFPSSGMSSMCATEQTAKDLEHHRKSSRRREEEAEWIVKDVPMRYYTPRNVPLTTVQLMLGRTPEIMKWLQARIGLPFPYTLKYYQFVAPELPSAMENVTLTTWGSDYLLNSVWAMEYGQATESINVHEMAHSYFGNAVGVAHWEHAWLKEGWANYLECCWQQDKYGPDAFSYMIYRNGRLYMKESDLLYARPIVTRRFDSSWDLYDQHLYRGASRRIHSLRCILGDDIFWPAVTDFLRSYQGRLVDTDDFRKILERHSHRNLQPFFNQWFLSPGYPHLDITFEYSSSRQTATITAKQTQMDERRGIGTFDMVIPIDIAYLLNQNSSTSSSNTSTSGNTGNSSSSSSSKVKWIKTSLVFLGGATEAVASVHIPQNPLQVLIDRKQNWVLSFSMDPGFSILRTMALHCWSPPHRIWAAQTLIDRGSPQDIEVVSEMLLRRESHWGVIAEVSMALAKAVSKNSSASSSSSSSNPSNSTSSKSSSKPSHHSNIQNLPSSTASVAAPVLTKLLLAPPSHPAQHPRALMAIALALSHIKDARIAGAIRQYLALKKYTSLHKIDTSYLRSIVSWSSMDSLVALSEQMAAAKAERADSSDGDTSDDSDSDVEEGYYVVEQPGRSSKTSKSTSPRKGTSTSATSSSRANSARAVTSSNPSSGQRSSSLTSAALPGSSSTPSLNSMTSTSPRELDETLAAAAKGDNTIPYKTHGRLLEALASQGDPNDEPLLIEQAERTRYGWLGITRGSALLALAEFGTNTAFEYILEATRVTAHQHLKARIAAVAALARCTIQSKMAPPLLARAIHTLHLLLHDPTYPVRFGAVHALFKLIPLLSPQATHESLSYMHQIRKNLSNQDRMWLKRKRILVRSAMAPPAPPPPRSGDLDFGRDRDRDRDRDRERERGRSERDRERSVDRSSDRSRDRRDDASPSLQEFLQLKKEFASLKARVKAIEMQIHESDSSDDDSDASSSARSRS